MVRMVDVARAAGVSTMTVSNVINGRPGVAADTTRLAALAGPNAIGWRDGFRRMVATMHPERLAAGAAG